jgi:hypothetical protein
MANNHFGSLMLSHLSLSNCLFRVVRFRSWQTTILVSRVDIVTFVFQCIEIAIRFTSATFISHFGPHICFYVVNLVPSSVFFR